MKNNIKKCAICGKECELTYEHIPPKKSFNNSNVNGYFGDEVFKLITSENREPWDFSNLKYKQMQKGVGLYSLCKECNNYTGSKYGDFYNAFVRKNIEYINNNYEQYMKGDIIRIKSSPFLPLRFIKQVISMFCSTTIGLNNKYGIMKELLLDASKTINNVDFKISMGMVKNQIISFGGSVGYAYSNGNKRVVSEIIAFPFIFLFDHNKNINEKRLIDITHFLKYNYDEEIDLDMDFPIVERNITTFPADYRTKEEILKDKRS